MRCENCGSQMKSRLENYRYSESGLDTVTLRNVEVRRCPECGEHDVVIPFIEDLHRVIATELAWKRTKLTGSEIRFMRKYMGFSSGDFARVAGTTAETVSRWENGKQPMGPQAERMLRLMVLMKEPPEEPPHIERLADVANGKAEAKPVRFRYSKKHWQPEGAAA